MIAVIILTSLFFVIFVWLTIHAIRMKATIASYNSSQASEIGHSRVEHAVLKSTTMVPPSVLHTTAVLPVLGFLQQSESEKFQAEERKPYQISQDVLVSYSKVCPINRAFPLRVIFSPQKQFLKALKLLLEKEKTRKDKPGFAMEHLSFEALEREPKIKVELTFPEGTFKADATSFVKRLQEYRTTEFTFSLVPLVGTDLLVYVRVKYLQKALEVVEETEEKGTTKADSRTKTADTGTAESQKHSSKVQLKEEEVEILAIEVPVSAKAFWKLDSTQLTVANRAVGLVVVAVMIILVRVFFPTASVFYPILVGTSWLVSPLLGTVDFAKLLPPKEPDAGATAKA
jgi:hypothetical protein